jgi:hypothetical protein
MLKAALRAIQLGIYGAVALGTCAFSAVASAKCPQPTDTSYANAAKAQFECSSNLPLKEPTQERKFQIKLDFPASQPTAAILPWQSIDFERQPEAYVRALLAYGVADNDAVDWRIEDNAKSKWCHAPWFQNAREGLRGMTRERGSRVKELHEQQVSDARNWAIGFYNDLGCFTLGQVWKDPSFPKTKGLLFPEGTYSIKLLFTTAPPSQVPYLAGSKQWNAAIDSDGGAVTMRLLQVDVAARDKRADKHTGWLFGTFIYDADTPGQTVWDKLVPVGLMWGNDPTLTSGEYETKGAVPQEGWLNPIVAKKFFHLPRHNLGLHGRVNGPVDNPKAACLACHARALDWGRAIGREQAAEAAELLPFAPSPYDDAGVTTFFRNRKPHESFVTGTQSLDYSLQLAVGIGNFRSWVAREFPDQAANTTDVEPYKFKSEKGLMGLGNRAMQLLTSSDRSNNSVPPQLFARDGGDTK